MRRILLSLALGLGACSGTNNGGSGWTKAAELPPGSTTRSINVLVDGTDVLVATDQGLFRTSDDGATWKASSTGLPPPAGMSSGVSPVEALGTASGTLFAGTDDGTFKSADHGASWTSASSGLPDTVSPYAFWTVGSVVLVGMNSGSQSGVLGGLFRSSDVGATWDAALGWPMGNGAISFAQLGNTVFTGFGASVGASTDSGQTWTASGAPGGSNALWLDTQNGFLFCATATAGVWKSADATNWTQAASGLPLPDITSTVFAHAGKLYAGTDHSGVFISSDDGASWKDFSDGFGATKPRVVQFAVHGTTLFGVTEAGGVWKHAL